MTKTDLTKSIRTWLDGNEKEFTPVFHYYHDKLMQFSERFLSDGPLIEELVMNVLFKVWSARDRISDGSMFNAYIYSAMRNEIVSCLRLGKKAVAPLEAISNEPFVHSDYEFNAITEQYKASVKKLPRRRQEIFLMSLEQGLTYPQIAEKLNISVFTVQKQATAAIQAVRGDVGPK